MANQSKIQRAIGVGYSSIDVFPVPIVAPRAPVATDVDFPYGQKWLFGNNEYTYVGEGVWQSPEILSVDVTVSSAEVLALGSSPKQLVAAPGAGLILEFVGAILILDYNSTQYTESADNMAIRYTDGSGVIVSETIECTGFIDAAADTVTNAVPKKDAIVAASGCVNQPLVLDNINDEFEAGNSPLTVSISYRVVTSAL